MRHGHGQRGRERQQAEVQAQRVEQDRAPDCERVRRTVALALRGLADLGEKSTTLISASWQNACVVAARCDLPMPGIP